ncbi:DUF72 domain-containing protein [Desulfopila aestuarii]|uniref:Uncharacterized conserved protein YecE, DUF72 family n=1 Tax=Desulfopila aestuarii DSM 18488 TaxID=1121416 RepID=A0A1M7YCS0_9BACT|nr:DUF72 domain-containing protein [Desulfopila aestuarii]SHO50427.1 Uncharacterized conserved protein YecE, DUF72 family [Desulfopila aestuarii DSM 18488]
MKAESLHIGTCSWKYPSWEGLVYSERKPANYLQEYSHHYNTVEVDQWFWSLFASDKLVLPKLEVVSEYAASVPENFTFCVKVPNSITLTHHYKKNKSDPLVPNPHFLSIELIQRFFDSLQPLHHALGPLMFQFEYLNKQKMSGVAEFIDKFGPFAEKLPTCFTYCIESRNPNYLTTAYLNFLRSTNLHHIFLQGYYMPSIFDVYREHRERIDKLSVIRLHGPSREEIEKQVGDDWSQIVAPKDQDIKDLVQMIEDLKIRNVKLYLLVNNHFEGSAPRTIARIEEAMIQSVQRHVDLHNTLNN